MNLKELMMEFLHKEGFCPKDEEFGIGFKFEGRSLVMFYDEEDELFFRLLMPNIYDVTEENHDIVMNALNEVNSNFKVVKAFTPVPGSVWIGFEILMDTTPVLEDIVPRAVGMLCAAQKAFYAALESGE